MARNRRPADAINRVPQYSSCYAGNRRREGVQPMYLELTIPWERPGMVPLAPTGKPIYSTLARDPDLVEIVDMFVAELPERIAAILQYLEHQDWDALRRAAHQLKGAGGSYGFEPITNSAARVEQLVREVAPEESIRDAVADLAQICYRAQTRPAV